MRQDNTALWRSYARALTARNRSELTIASYHRAVTELDHFLDADLSTATRADIETYLAKRLTEIAATTVAIRFRSLRAFFRWCEGEGIVKKSPMLGLQEPKAPDDPPPVLDDEQLRALLKACSGKTFVQRRDEAIIRLFCEPGSPRLAEMAGLTVESLDMGRQAASTALWLGVKGPLGDSGVAQMLARRSAQASVGHVHPHQLRHSAAHAWMDNGGSEGDAMALFGWSSSEMPRRYGRSARVSRAQRAARRFSLGDRL
jgi:site-specific recombinase XerD